jgi:hypothetical protein
MTTYFNFAPSQVAPFSFSPVLDGQPYNATVPWVLFGQRFYLNLIALSGAQIWYGAIVGSPTGTEIAAISWANGIVSAVTATPHGYKIASTVELTIVGCTPMAYNGLNTCLITGSSSFSYMLANDPGPATVFGVANFNVNLLGGVPNETGVPFSSTLVFRQQSNQFEVSP